MPDRVVKTTLVIDDHGSVKVVKGVGEEAGRTEHKLGSLDKSVKGVGKSFGGLKSLLMSGAGLVGAGGLIFGLSDVISKTKEVAQETEKFHSITGAGTQASLRYSQALKARGLDSEALTRAFGFLDKNVHSAELQEKKFGQTQEKSGQATNKASVAQEKSRIAVEKARLSLAKAEQTGKAYTVMQARLGLQSAEAGAKVGGAAGKAAPELGRQAKAMEELGIQTSAYVKLKPEDKIKTVTKAFENLAAGEKKTRLERELFGKGGNALSIVLEKNSLSLENTASKVERYFGVIHGGQRGQEELLAKQAEAKLAFEGLEFQLGTKLTPVLIKVFETFSKVTAEIDKGKGPWAELAKVFEGIYKFGKGVADTIKEIAKALGVKLPEGTLGAVLAAAGLHAAKHPVKDVKKAGGFVKKVGEHPELAPVAAGGAIPFVSALGLRAGAEAISPGYLKERSLPEVERTLFPRGRPGVGYGNTAAGGKAAAGETPGEAALVAKAIESLKPTHDTATINLHLDSVKVAEAQIHNPRARRLLAEAATIYAHGMAARGHG